MNEFFFFFFIFAQIFSSCDACVVVFIIVVPCEVRTEKKEVEEEDENCLVMSWHDARLCFLCLIVYLLQQTFSNVEIFY
jgi:hypothetical protein